MASDAPTRALVLCGGASRGALEVGFLKAIGEEDVEFDFVVGTSIGAFNGAMFASGMSVAEIEEVWLGFNRWKAVRPNWGWALRPRTQPGLFSLDPMRGILRDMLPVTRFENLELPLWVTSTELNNGRARYWGETGDIIEPVIASMSVPGIFAPVILDDRLHVDGGITNNVPLDFATHKGAQEIFLIDCYCDEPCLRPPRGLIQILMRSFSTAVSGKYEADLARIRNRVKIFRVQPKLDNNIDLLDFSRSRDFISIGYEATRAALERPLGDQIAGCCEARAS